jgi:NADH-quinone oxidoreductase subunit A
VVLGLLAFCGALVLVRFVAPRNPGREKLRPYECGVAERGDPWSQFKVQFYLYALVFVVFDVEALYLYPWAVVFAQSGAPALAAMAAFIGVLVLAWLYAWRKGALEWD